VSGSPISPDSVNKTYRLIWNSLTQAWQAVAETARGRGKSVTAGTLLAASVAFCGTALAVPAVFFDGVTANGQSTFSNVVTTASPTATIFSYDFTSSASNTFSVTQGGTTVYVRTSRNGTANSFNSGLDEWSVNYNVNGGTAGWTEAVNEGFKVEFFSDASYTTPYLINAVGITVDDWGTCCTSGGVTPDGSVVPGSAIYAVFDAAGTPSATLIGNITNSADRATLDNRHFVAAIDDRNSFNSVTFVPNGSGEAFGAGGTLLFSIVPLNSVPAGSSSVTVGQPQVPNIDTTRSNFTTQELSASQVNPVFDGGTLTLANSGTVTANFEVRATGGTIDTAGQDGVFTGVIADSAGASGAITKAGAGTLTLAGANTYTGTTTVSGGTLELTGSLASTDIRIGAGGTLLSANGGLAAASTVEADGTLALGADETIASLTGSGSVDLGSHTLGVGTGSFSGVVGGTGDLQKTGAGTLTLGGANTYTGTTTVSGGTLELTGSLASTDIRIGAGSTLLSANGGLAGTSTVAANGTLSLGANEAIGTLTGSGAVNLGANTLGVGAGTFSGVVGGTGDLQKTGAGTLTLSGANTYTGTTTVSAGTLELTGSLASTDVRIGVGSTLLSANGGLAGTSTVAANGTLALGANEAIGSLTGSGAVNLGGNTLGVGAGTFSGVVGGTGELQKTGAGTLTLSGTNTHTGTTRVSGGILSVGADANLGAAGASVALDGGTLQTTQSLSTTKAFDVSANGGALNVATGTSVVMGGALSGAGALDKQGTGSLVLNGPSTFTGTIDVSQGLLRVQADLAAASGIVVRNGATLGGTGNVGGGVTVLNGGRLSPGASPGTLTVAGDVLLNSGSLFDVDIDGYGQGTGAGSYDRVVITGNHTFTAAGTITPIMRGITGSATNNFTAQVGDVFNIVQAADGSVTGRFDTLVQPTTGGLPARTRFDVIYGATTINLVVLPQLFAEAATLGGGKRNAVNAGTGLDGIYVRTDINGTDAPAQLLRSLTGLTEQALAVRMASLSGEAHATALAEATRDSQGLRDAIFSRQPVDQCDSKAPRQEKASSALPDDCRRVWAQVSRVHHDAAANDWTSATRAQSTLTSVGIERRVRPGMTGGLALGLGQGKVSSAFTSDRVENDSVQLSAYLTVDTRYGEFTQVAGVGLGRHDVQREIDAVGNALNERRYNSARVFADSRLKTPLAQWGSTSLSSVVGLRLDYLHRAAKTEAGDAASALELASYNKLHGLAQVGAVLNHTLSQTEKSRSELQLDMTYGYQLGGKAGVGTDVGLHGSAWGVRSAGDGPQQLTVGLSVGDIGPRSALSLRAYAGYAKGGNNDRGLQFTYSRQW
jgi:autotransporter-associated beta strand protein